MARISLQHSIGQAGKVKRSLCVKNKLDPSSRFDTILVCCDRQAWKPDNSNYSTSIALPSVLWSCWLGSRKGIQPVKCWVVRCWRGYQSGARCRLENMHMAQRLPLPLTVSCFSKIQIGFTFLVPAHLVVPEKGPLNGCVCVCIALWTRVRTTTLEYVLRTNQALGGLDSLQPTDTKWRGDNDQWMHRVTGLTCSSQFSWVHVLRTNLKSSSSAYHTPDVLVVVQKKSTKNVDCQYLQVCKMKTATYTAKAFLANTGTVKPT